MRRRAAIIATAAAAALGGGLLLAPNAQADPSICIDLDLTIQDQSVVENVCLPPADGGGTPELPALPALPVPPAG